MNNVRDAGKKKKHANTGEIISIQTHTWYNVRFILQNVLLILFLISLSLQMYYPIILSFFFEKLRCINFFFWEEIRCINLIEIILFFVIKDRIFFFQVIYII